MMKTLTATSIHGAGHSDLGTTATFKKSNYGVLTDTFSSFCFSPAGQKDLIYILQNNLTNQLNEIRNRPVVTDQQFQGTMKELVTFCMKHNLLEMARGFAVLTCE